MQRLQEIGGDILRASFNVTFNEKLNNDIREKGAEYLAYCIDKYIEHDIIEQLQSENPKIREVAIAILDESEGTNHIDLLVEVAVSHVIEKEIFDFIGTLGDDSHIDLISPLLQHDNSDVIASAVAVIGTLGDVSHIDLISPLLQHDNNDVIASPVAVIGTLGDVSHIDLIIPLLQNDNSDVRYRAIEAIGTLGDADHIDLIIPLLQDDNSDVRYRAIGVIGTLGDADHIDLISPLLQHDNSDVRYRAIEAIGTLADADHIDLITPLLQDKDSNVKASAVEAIGTLGDADHIDLIIPLLQDENWSVRRNAVNLIAELGDISHIDFISPLLQDDDSDVLEAVFEVIGKYQRHDLLIQRLYALQGIFDDEDGTKAQVILKHLIAIAAPVTLDVLPDVINAFVLDPDYDLPRKRALALIAMQVCSRDEAVPEMLTQFSNIRTIKDLGNMLDEEREVDDPVTNEHIITTLKSIDHPVARGILAEWETKESTADEGAQE